MKDFIIVAIDGTAASGKSTTAARLAEALGCMNVNTGNHYRCLTSLLIRDGNSYDDFDSIGEFLGSAVLDTKLNGNCADLVINGMTRDQLDARSGLVNDQVSMFAKNQELRKFLKKYQQSLVDFARQNGFGGIVMEGRDICSVVLPEADFKFFLTADRGVRVNRSINDNRSDNICLRDSIDYSESNITKDAIKVDTTHLDMDQVLAFMIEVITASMPARRISDSLIIK
ncbi:MAG: (d)CMP kinase [Puniceicoccales bacterium]|jgi:cytidylate kinase|nr:(d)CMP kinase [Puniceicoccales bacterium]